MKTVELPKRKRTTQVRGEDGENPKRKRHAEKVVTRKGVLVKIELVADTRKDLSEKTNIHKPGSVCVHVFADYDFRDLRRTLYGVDAIKIWTKVLAAHTSLFPHDLTTEEFGKMMFEVKKCTLTSDKFFMEKRRTRKQK